jgi:SAM-dependent methyltransferase
MAGLPQGERAGRRLRMKIRTESDFDSLLRGAKLLAVASAWTELGLWDALARHEGGVDLSQLPGDLRALRITAAVLAHAGLLDGAGDLWRLSAIGRALHAQGQLPTDRNFETLQDLSRMAQVLRDGGPVRGPDGASKATRGGVQPADVEASRRFLDMLHRRSDTAAESAADWIVRRLPPGARVLDVGGGHGRYAEAFLRRGCTATLFDLPHVIEIARERYGDQLAYRPGDFHHDDMGGPYDCAFLSNIVHGESDAANADLTRRLFASLAPGGWVVFKDMFIDEQGRDPETAVFFGTTMLYYTQEGRSYTLRDVGAWCSEAGFEPPDVIGLETSSLVLARKPE